MTAGDPAMSGLLPITDDDATIAAALEDLSVPTLMVSMVHLTGDLSWIRGEVRPLGIYINEVQGFMSPEDQAAVRERALDQVAGHRLLLVHGTAGRSAWL